MTKFNPAALRRIQRSTMTLDELAERAASARSTLIDYIKGRKLPGIESLFDIASALGVDPLELTLADRDAPTLEDLRVQRGMSKRRLAEAIGVEKNTWDAIESGRRRLLSPVAEKAAAELDVTVDELVRARRRGGAED